MKTNFYYQPKYKQTKKEDLKKLTEGFNIKVDKPLLYNILNIFISGLLGGIAFSVGTTAYLSISNKAVGAAVFAVGMFMIFAYGFGFYTSKIGYSIKSNKYQNLSLIPLWFGNLVGAFSVGGLLSLTRENVSKTIYTRANQFCLEQINDSPLGIIILAFFCGIIMFVVTDNYKNAKDSAQKYLALFLGTMTFLLCGFDHFVSSAFCFAITAALSVKSVWYIILITFGNSLGALAIPVLHSCVKWLQKNANNK